jgi:serine/threonine-protein kinase
MIRTIVIWLIVIICAFGLGFFAFNFFIMPKIVGGGKNVVVPNLIGKPLVEAQRVLINQNFIIGDAKQVFDTIYPYGYIIGQKPLAGSVVKTGKKINFMVSKGPQMVKAPFLAQMSLEQGLRVLSSLGVNPSIVESLRSSTIPTGKIIGCEPGPGSEISISTRLKVFVSNDSSGMFLMPMLVGLSIQSAIDSIVNNGLIIGGIQEIASEESSGLVIIQYPEDGMKVFTGDTVRLIVAKGK